MRNFTFYSILVCLTASCGWLSPEPPTPMTDNNISIIDDRTFPTNSSTIRPDANLVLSIFDFSHNLDQAALVTYRFITDKKLNPEMPWYIANAQSTESDDPHFREKAVLGFYTDVRTGMDSMGRVYPPDTSFSKSEILHVLASEFRRLAGRPGKKVILAYTDLAQNSQFSCYDPLTKKEILEYPERVADSLNVLLQLPDLREVDLHVFYRPLTIEEDRDFHARLEVFRILLSKHNGHIYVHATNNIISFTDKIQ